MTSGFFLPWKIFSPIMIFLSFSITLLDTLLGVSGKFPFLYQFLNCVFSVDIIINVVTMDHMIMENLILSILIDFLTRLEFLISASLKLVFIHS